MKKSEYEAARLQFWQSPDAPPTALRFEVLVERDVVAAEAAGVTWEPEVVLPERLESGPHTREKGVVGLWVSLPGETSVLLRIIYGEPSTRPVAEAVALELLAAYNREREAEFESGPDAERFERELHRVTEAEIQGRIDAAVQDADERWTNAAREMVEAERARCLGHMDWLVSCFPEGWDFAKRSAHCARRRVQNGEPVRRGGFAGHPLSTPDGERCALCGKDWPHAHTREQVKAWRASGGACGENEETLSRTALHDYVSFSYQERGGETYAYVGEMYVFRVTARPDETVTDLLRAAYNSGHSAALDKVKDILTGKES